ncbi:alginate export family protein [Desertivirga xinjiangensis]|uniref:alginate export family protein n=1 Tax=Desertivirga xinjiangensis TaxID=539206 RepID=UPI00210E6AAC|nr:alginate export family protein [Pedobacter xinjiangensis]
MYKKVIIQRFLTTSLTAVAALSVTPAKAQISLTGQLRPRLEVRDGFANLTPETASPASFVSQRTRLNFGYKWDKVNFGVTLQDVRVWGQDASTISPADGNKLMLHEGWAELILADKTDSTQKFKILDFLSFKVGRQELIYDDARLIGNLDWLQQGRRFDMALIKALHHGWQVDMGYAYNQNTENSSGTAYTPGNVPATVKTDRGILVSTPSGIIPLTSANGNSSATGNPSYANPANTNAGNQNYKSFVSLYASKKINQTKLSFLAFKDNFSKYRPVSVVTDADNDGITDGTIYGRVYDVKGTNDRYTFGGMLSSAIKNVTIQGAYYHQLGEDRDGKKLNAFHASVLASYTKGKFSFGPGFDVLSGNKTTTLASDSKRFDPLYGTPHKFWGYMDYFYAPTGSPASGLKDYYFKTKYTTTKYYVSADLHRFDSNHSLAASTKKHLAHELDLVLNYSLNRFTNIELGYSAMMATSALSQAKGQDISIDYDRSPSFGYLMLNIRPDFLFKTRG